MVDRMTVGTVHLHILRKGENFPFKTDKLYFVRRNLFHCCPEVQRSVEGGTCSWADKAFSYVSLCFCSLCSLNLNCLFLCSQFWHSLFLHGVSSMEFPSNTFPPSCLTHLAPSYILNVIFLELFDVLYSCLPAPAH